MNDGGFDEGFRVWLRERIHELSFMQTSMNNMVRGLRKDVDTLLTERNERQGERKLVTRLLLVYVPGIAALTGILAFLITYLHSR